MTKIGLDNISRNGDEKTPQMSFMKLSHDPNETPTRKTNHNTKHVSGVQENGNTQIWNIRVAPSPNLTTTSHVPRNALEKNKNAPNTRNAFWHSIKSRLSHNDSQNKHSNTTVSHTSHVAKGASESKRRCLSSKTSASDLCIDWHPWLHAPHTHTHETQAWKNNSKQTHGTTCDDAQCIVKSRQEKLLSVNSHLETKLRILFVAQHVPESLPYWVRYGPPRWFAWQTMVQELAAGPSTPLPMWQTVRNQICNERSTSAKHTDALPWTHTPNNDNLMKKQLIWNSPLAIFNLRQIISKETFLTQQPTTDSISQPTTTNDRGNRLHNT